MAEAFESEVGTQLGRSPSNNNVPPFSTAGLRRPVHKNSGAATSSAPLLVEFQEVLSVGAEDSTLVVGGTLKQAKTLDGVLLPAGAKVIKAIPKSGVDGPSSQKELAKPTRVELCECQLEDPHVLYIGRSHRTRDGKALRASKWANPFKLKDYASRNECLA